MLIGNNDTYYMNTYIVLLRGINVSGQKKVPMAKLSQVLHQQGFKDIQTYIQSGNLILRTDLNKSVVIDSIGEVINNHFGFVVSSFIFTAEEFKDILEQSPFGEIDTGKLYLTFLNSDPKTELVESLPQSVNPREQFLVRDRAIHILCPDGYGRTKINNNFFERKLKVTATTRNWKTCIKLLEMVGAK